MVSFGFSHFFDLTHNFKNREKVEMNFAISLTRAQKSEKIKGKLKGSDKFSAEEKKLQKIIFAEDQKSTQCDCVKTIEILLLE
jgi:hypothetical protein